jgi:hypothetical protein
MVLVVLLHELPADIHHVVVGLPGILSMLVTDPLYEEPVVARFVVIWSGSYDSFGSPSFSISVNVDWRRRAFGIASVRLE